MNTTRKLMEFVIDCISDEFTKSEISDLVNQMEVENDIQWEIQGMEYRVIHEDIIKTIHKEEVQDLVQECYLGELDLDKYWWIAIDWDETAENVRMTDGYGNHFSAYDHSEEFFDGWYFFRTN